MWMQPVAQPQSLSASATVYKTMLNGTKHAQTEYHANNTIEAYCTDTHYENSNRQLGAYIIRYNQNGAVIQIILGGRII